MSGRARKRGTVGRIDAGQAVELTSDYLQSLVQLLAQLRGTDAITRPALAQQSGLGRAALAQRVNHLIDAGLIEEGDMASSTGGRAARQIRFRADAGRILVAEFGATSLSVAVTNLACGDLRREREVPLSIDSGPEACVAQLEQLFDELLQEEHPHGSPVRGIGIGLPGPVEFATGRPISPPIMPGWDNFPIRERLVERYGAPVWVDNEVNLMALGEYRAGLAAGERQTLFVKIGTGIGAGLISNGLLHRGAQGCAGDIGHIAVAAKDPAPCRCGNRGCLEAHAGGNALARLGTAVAEDGRSPFLAEVLERTGRVTARDVAAAASHGDIACRDILAEAAHLIGDALASVVNFFNPSLILIGGGVANSGDAFLAGIREATYGRALPLATRDLRMTTAPLGMRAGTTGAAYMVSDELFSAVQLEHWLVDGEPALNGAA